MECSTKKKYFESKHKAQLRAIEINSENRINKIDLELRAYKCLECEGFHLSSMTESTYRKIVTKKKVEYVQKQSRRLEREAEYWLDKFNLE